MEWIKVSDRLPDMDTYRVLVTIRDEDQPEHFAHVEECAWDELLGGFVRLFFDAPMEYVDGVVAWMPYPAPYDGD